MKKNTGSMEKWMILLPEQKKHMKCLEYLVMPESKEMLQKWWEHLERTWEPTRKISQCSY